MTVSLPVVIEFEPPGPLLNMNDRRNRFTQSTLVKAWRTAAYFETCRVLSGGPSARRLGGPWPVLVTVSLPVKSGRHDPHNWYPTVKALCDGITDAEVWPDDSSEWVRTTEPVMERGRKLVRVEITPSSPT